MINTASGVTTVTSSASVENVIAASAGLVFRSADNSQANVAVSGGNNDLTFGYGSQAYVMSAAQDTITANGNSTIDAGGGSNIIKAMGLSSLVYYSGNDIVAFASGASTVSAGAGTSVVFGNSTALNVVGGTGSIKQDQVGHEHLRPA